MNDTHFEVRPARPDDYPQIAALMSQTFMHRNADEWLALWKWRYDQNPARQEAVTGFMVGDENGKVIGAHGLLPSRIKLGTAIIPMMCLADFAVDSATRGKGYGTKIRTKILSAETSPFTISTSSNRVGNKFTLSLGGREVPAGRRKYIRPLKTSGFMKVLGRRQGGLTGWIMTNLLGKMLGPAVDWSMVLKRTLFSAGHSKNGIFDVERFDSRFDRFWEKASVDYPVIFVRDAAYLNWRFADYPFGRIERFAARHGEETTGFAIVHYGIDDEGLKFAALLEHFVRRHDLDTLRHLLKEVIRRADRERVDYIMVKTSIAAWETVYQQFGFKMRQGDYSPYTYNNNANYASELVDNPDNWYISLGDGDMCFF